MAVHSNGRMSSEQRAEYSKTGHKFKWKYHFVSLRNWLTFDSRLKVIDENAIQNAISNRISCVTLNTRRLDLPVFYDYIDQIYNDSIINWNSLAFLKKEGPRLVNLAWLMINKIHSTNHFNLMIPFADRQDLRNELVDHRGIEAHSIYQFYFRGQVPFTESEIREKIVNFFDLYEAPKTYKEFLVNQIKVSAAKILAFENSFDWLKPNDEVQLGWAYKYLDTRGLLARHFPSSSLEMKRHAIVASFDDYDAQFEVKKLLLLEMKRAWSTQKHRNKLIDKKPYSFIMSTKISKILDNLTKDSNESKNELLERLILTEFESKKESNAAAAR